MRLTLLVFSLLLNCGILFGQNKQNADTVAIRSFSEVADSMITFKASIKLPGRSLSGLLIIKRTDSITYRTALISELGMNLFELKLLHDSFQIISYLDAFKKHGLIQLLAEHVFYMVHPFTAISKPVESVKRTIINYNFADLGYACRLDSLHRITSAKTGKLFSRKSIHYTYSIKQIPLHITLKQSGIRIKWNLELLEQY